MNGLKVKGFTLLEIMIALAIFAGFATSIALFQSAEIKGSAALREELILNNLAMLKINELKVKPPDLGISKTLVPDKGDFKDFPDYKYTITYKTMDFSNLDLILLAEDEDSNEYNSSNLDPARPMIKMIGNHLKDTLWMVKVTVERGNYKTSLSTWLVKNQGIGGINAFQL